MLAFLTTKQNDGKKRLVLVIDPDTRDRIQEGKPVTMDLADVKIPIPLVVVLGFTPSAEELQKELEKMGMKNGVLDGESLVLALHKCSGEKGPSVM